jgi:hypothetical protein
VVRKLNEVLIWFIRLIKRDEANFEEDSKVKRKIYRRVRKNRKTDKEKRT